MKKYSESSVQVRSCFTFIAGLSQNVSKCFVSFGMIENEMIEITPLSADLNIDINKCRIGCELMVTFGMLGVVMFDNVKNRTTWIFTIPVEILITTCTRVMVFGFDGIIAVHGFLINEMIWGSSFPF